MQNTNIEIKAKVRDLGYIEQVLQKEKARFKGSDHQVDTYFNVLKGKLKLRESNIDNRLIYYEREEQKGPKESKYRSCPIGPNTTLASILHDALGIDVKIEKDRDIYEIDNVLFHLDRVERLGGYVEIQARSKPGELVNKEHLTEQVVYYLNKFGVTEDALESVSYSDLLEKE